MHSLKDQRVSLLNWSFPPADHTYSLVILNQPVQTSNVITNLILKAEFTLCADGGANQLHDAYPDSIPDMILGDLDSINQHSFAHYTSKGVPIVKDACQDTTDLTKCLTYLSQSSNITSVSACILIL